MLTQVTLEIERKMMNKNNEWYTPVKVLCKVREVLGEIDIDPASCALAQEKVMAKEYYTEENSGLLVPWEGKVFCNPPYSASLIKKFTGKFTDEAASGSMTEGIILTNSGTDTLWNQNLICFTQAYTIGRISFVDPEGNSLGKGGRGQVFTYFGPNVAKFIEVFTTDEFCWVPNLHLLTYN
jgi:ParB family chromosome partitioning protein